MNGEWRKKKAMKHSDRTLNRILAFHFHKPYGIQNQQKSNKSRFGSLVSFFLVFSFHFGFFSSFSPSLPDWISLRVNNSITLASMLWVHIQTHTNTKRANRSEQKFWNANIRSLSKFFILFCFSLCDGFKPITKCTNASIDTHIHRAREGEYITHAQRWHHTEYRRKNKNRGRC